MVEIPEEYKNGFKNFLGQKIDLSKFPFIPREETEYWTHIAIKEISEKSDISCLDLFSGSGCIGLAILKNTNANCDFGEKEDDFIEQIKINIKLAKISENKYSVFKTDIFSGIKKKYDYILANPPYIAEERISEVGKDVLFFEPKIALFSGNDGLDIIIEFLNEAKKHLNEKGIIFLEFNPEQEQQIDIILKKNDYSSWNFFCDQFGLIRFVRIAL